MCVSVYFLLCHGDDIIKLLSINAPVSREVLVAFCLHLMNTYCSTPLKHVVKAADLHHVPGKIMDLLLDYYNNFCLSFISGPFISE